MRHRLWDLLVCNKFKMALGGNAKFICTGAAPIDGDLLSKLKILFCVNIVEGYGMTETSALATCTIYDENKAGNVGFVSRGCEIKLEDVPDMK